MRMKKERFYVNGEEKASGTLHKPNNVIRTSNYIGKDNWVGSQLMNGIIDDIKIWKRGLEEKEIKLNYLNLIIGKYYLIAGTQIELKGINNNKIYKFRVAAVNEEGRGTFKEITGDF